MPMSWKREVERALTAIRKHWPGKPIIFRDDQEPDLEYVVP